MRRLIPDCGALTTPGSEGASEESVTEICKQTVKWGGSPRGAEISAQECSRSEHTCEKAVRGIPISASLSSLLPVFC